MKKLLLGLGMALMMMLAMPSMAMPETPMLDDIATADVQAAHADAIQAVDAGSVNYESAISAGEALRQRPEHSWPSDNYLSYGPGDGDEDDGNDAGWRT